MTISVVIPAYNEEKFIRNCLLAIRKQTQKPAEIIVVDNNSTDKTVEIIREFPEVRVIPELQQGISYARNRGFDEASGDIIARCDADTVAEPHWIEKIHTHFLDITLDGLTGPYSFFDSRHRKALDALRVTGRFAELSKLMFGHYPFIGGNMAIRASAWKKVRSQVCMDEKKLHEDIDLALHLAHTGGKIVYDPDLVMPTSARRMDYPIRSLLKYFARWPGTKMAHKRRSLKT